MNYQANALERAARICDIWMILFPDRDADSIHGWEVADALADEIRKQKELL